MRSNFFRIPVLAVLGCISLGCSPAPSTSPENGQQDSNTADGTASPPSAVVSRVESFSGVPSEDLTFHTELDGYRADYDVDRRHVSMHLAPDGMPSVITESLTYVPYVPSEANRRLEEATSATEDFAETVIAEDPGLSSGLKSLSARVAALNGQVGASSLKPITSSYEQVSQALGQGDPRAAAHAALDLYDRLQDAKDWRGAPVPSEVARLDGAGFRIELEASGAPPDWAAVGKSVAAAHDQWHAVRDQVSNSNLTTVVDGIVANLESSGRTRKLAELRAANKQMLAAVDLLEQYFETKYRRGASVETAD